MLRSFLRYDQQNLSFSENGKTGKVLPVNGPGIYDTASVVGGFGKDWFNGEIKSFRIEQGIVK